MGFLNTISKPAAAATPPPATPAVSSQAPKATPAVSSQAPKATPKLPIRDESTPQASSSPELVACSPRTLVQRGIYRMQNGEERMFLCHTPQGYSFAAMTKGAMPVLVPEGTWVTFVRDAGPNTDPAPVLPPDAPKSDPALASRKDPATQAATTPAEAPVEKPKKEKKAAPKSESPAKEIAVNVTVPAPHVQVDVQMSATSGPRTRVYVNCIVPGLAGQSLLPYVEELSAKLLKACGENVLDIRMAHGDALGFGKWKGALAVAAKHTPPPAGDYLVTGDDERIHAVLPELAKFCASGDFVVGR